MTRSPVGDGRSGRAGWRAGRRPRHGQDPHAEHPRAEHPRGEHPRGEHPRGEHPRAEKTHAGRPAYTGPRLPPTRVESEGEPTRTSAAPPGRDDAADAGPAKLTVTRVAAWRTRRLTRRGVAAFHRAAAADGADRSGLTALTYAWMANHASDAALAVALANTLFFSAASAESRDKVALYLLVTVAPFALIAPVIGPLLDRVQRGRRAALASSMLAQGALAVLLALAMDTWALYPAALGIMVLSKSFGVLKGAVVPRVVPPGIGLVTTNSRLTMFGLAASAVGGAVAAGLSWLAGPPGAAWLTAVVCGLGVWLCLRIPGWVEVTEGEMATTVLRRPDPAQRRGVREGPWEGSGRDASPRRRVPLTRTVVTALWSNGAARALTGFLTLFAAFVIKGETEGSPGEQLVLLGLVGAAAGAGSVMGNAVGARQRFAHPERLLVAAPAVALGAVVLAAFVVGVATAAVVALVAATASALLKVCLDAVLQRDVPEAARASAFGRSETVLQLSWVFGGALGVLLPPTWWLGFTVIAVVVALGTVQTVLSSLGRTLLPLPRRRDGAPDGGGVA